MMDQKICKQIEELILKQSSQSLSKQESNWIKIHLSDCASCRSFSERIKEIAKAMVAEPETSLHPDPSIRDNIIQRMEGKTEKTQSIMYDIFDTLGNIFGYRIPLYQAVLAMVIILITLFALDFSGYPTNTNTTGSEIAKRIETVPNDVMLMAPAPELSRQKIGINAQEDSMLIRYLFTQM